MQDVWITGIGLVTSEGEGVDAHRALCEAPATVKPRVEEAKFAPFAVHPLPPIDYKKQITKNTDLRQMEGWQRLGVYAAGLALADAGVKGNAALLDHCDLVVAAGSGERDTAVDIKVLEASSAAASTGLLPNEVLPSALRPTLFLAQLSNLLAGNISIVHNVTASSRTFMGEEMAGLAAIDGAWRRVAAGQSELCLVGGALAAERPDLLLGYEIGHNLWAGPYRPVRERLKDGGGFIAGSMGAFLILESRKHAETRGAKAYARIGGVATDRTRRQPGDVGRALTAILDGMGGSKPAAPRVLSGATGVEPATSEELALADKLGGAPAWIYGDAIGHGVEAHFPAGVALAAIALDARAKTGAKGAPIVVTGTGHWRGEGLAIIESIA